MSAQHLEFVRAMQQNGHEIWHHGWDHSRAVKKGEFCEHGFAYQQQHLVDAQQLIADVYGIHMKTFGAPFNCTDATLTEVIEKQNDIVVTLFVKKPLPKNTLNLKRSVDLEIKPRVPSFEWFYAGYQQHPDEPYYVLQAHPDRWEEGTAELTEFKKIIKFLLGNGHAFTTPFDFYLSQRPTL